MRGCCYLLGFLMAAGAATDSFGQGLLLDREHRLPRPIPRPEVPQSSYRIKELIVNARIEDQVARTQVTQTFVNTGNRTMEVCFAFPLPYDGAIDQLTFMVDGKEFAGKLLPADEARRIYEGYIRRNQDPALLEWMGTGMFQTSIFPVPPNAERTVTLKYSQLLRKDQKLTDFLFPLSTAKYTSTPIETLKFDLSLTSRFPIKSIYSPTHPVTIEKQGEKHARIQLEAKDRVPTTDFRLFFDTNEGKLGASLLSYWPEDADEGFFLLLASPRIKSEDQKPTPKTVIFTVDRSGSMSGKKIEQARNALRFVLNNLSEGDLFNIIAYDSDVESFRPELERFNDQTRQEALAFVDGIYAGGSTAIDAALKTSLSMIQDESRPSYIVFLTDGKPTAGETNEMKIVENARQVNGRKARIISLGVGYDVNSRMLDRLTAENRGQSQYVRPDEDLEVHVSRLYNNIAAPVLTEVEIDYLFDKKDEASQWVNRIYPAKVFEIFAGQQLVVTGRYRQAGAAKIRISGQVGEEKQKFSFPATFVKQSYNESNSFVEKLWAMRRIGEIIDELDLRGKNPELIEELVGLSTKHGILTPYTSFLADDQAPANRLTDNRRALDEAESRLGRLAETGGVSGFAQRDLKRRLKSADQLPSADRFGDESLRLADNAAGAGSGGLGRGAAENAPANQPPGAKSPARPLAGGIIIDDIDSDRQLAVDSVQVVGKNTIYRRGDLLIDASAKEIDLEKDKASIHEIKRFSPEYFQLTAQNSKSENAVLALQKDDQRLLIRLRDKVYLIR